MKSRIIYIWLLVAMGLVSCNDWLNVSPKSEVKSEELFETEGGFKDALIGIYVGMTDMKVYGMNLSWGAIEFMAAHYQSPNGKYGELQRYNYENGEAQNIVNGVWNKQYNLIANVNLLLRELDKHEEILNPTTYNIIKGEALALRAMLHFDLIRLYAKGNLANKKEYLTELCIPYVTQYSKETTEQRSYSETLELIHQDINEALKCLVSDPMYPENIERPNGYEELMKDLFFAGTKSKGRETRMSYPAALLLNARVYLWENNQEKALEYANLLISACETYVATGKKIWAPDSEYVEMEVSSDSKDYVFYDELLFSLDVTKLALYLENAYSSSMAGSQNPDRLIQHHDFVKEIFSFDSGEANSDLRYKNQYEVVPDVKESLFAIKIRKTGTVYYSDIIPLMRMSEAYLIAAECLIHTDKAQAVEYMNFLKEKRNIQKQFYLKDDISESDLMNAIIKEYRKEFTSEGQIFFLYKRLGLTTFPGIQTKDKEITDEQYQMPYPKLEQDLGGRN